MVRRKRQDGVSEGLARGLIGTFANSLAILGYSAISIEKNHGNKIPIAHLLFGIVKMLSIHVLVSSTY
jgi:hypothetical protein